MRYWTVEEAEAYLPRVVELIAILKRNVPAARASGNGHRQAGRDHVQGALDELNEGSIVLRRLDDGLVDFPARGADGEVYYLCWKQGEQGVGWWHGVDEGFPGRKRLPRSGG
ncbi:MAG: DUF2203 domain-containing protein [Acidimicrobiales bacterium]